MTVREAFEKAFYPLPEGVTGCYIGAGYDHEPTQLGATIRDENQQFKHLYGSIQGSKWERADYEFGPDISEEDAYPFRDFFGGEYKAVVEAEREVPK